MYTEAVRPDEERKQTATALEQEEPLLLQRTGRQPEEWSADSGEVMTDEADEVSKSQSTSVQYFCSVLRTRGSY